VKILYLSQGNQLDYQDDCLFIGLKELFGSDIIDHNKRTLSYYPFTGDPSNYYGRGMTVTGILPDLEVDRTDIFNKIQNKYFDYIVYGSIHRYNDFLNDVLNIYPKNKIIVVDGEDSSTAIHPVFTEGVVYFKRELIFQHPRLIPISFAMPTTKGSFITDKKNNNLSFTKPREVKNFDNINPEDIIGTIMTLQGPVTQIRVNCQYNTEEEYYQNYQNSRFAITSKKGGWDCLRHYEIIGNGCIPIFENIKDCPNLTLTLFPKKLCNKVNRDIKKGQSYEEIYDKYIQQFEKHFWSFLTTQALAKYFISKIFTI
jgi:hypothetical protein